jgi:histone H3/H4
MNTKVGTRRSRYQLTSVAVCITALIGFLMVWSHGCSSGSQNAVNSPLNSNEAATTSNTPAHPASADEVNTAAESIPTSLADTGEYGENIYDYAKANDWNATSLKLEALRESAKDVRTDVKNQSDATDSLDEHVAALGLAVAVKDRQTAMREANRVTLDVANMTTAYKLSVPVEVIKLDYYGRELEIWAEAKDANNLQATAGEMRGTWDSLRKSVEARSAAEAKKFEALVAQVESARTPSDYASVATLVLNEVDNLEKLFH